MLKFSCDNDLVLLFIDAQARTGIFENLTGMNHSEYLLKEEEVDDPRIAMVDTVLRNFYLNTVDEVFPDTNVTEAIIEPEQFRQILNESLGSLAVYSYMPELEIDKDWVFVKETGEPVLNRHLHDKIVEEVRKTNLADIIYSKAVDTFTCDLEPEL